VPANESKRGLHRLLLIEPTYQLTLYFATYKHAYLHAIYTISPTVKVPSPLTYIDTNIQN
jgi:hypothetical protein